MTEGTGRRSPAGTHLLRFLPVLLILVLALVFLVPAVFKSCLPDQGGHLVTRAKLQNLKVIMAQLVVVAVQGDIAFPESRDDLLDLMEQEFGKTVRREETDPENPLVDGWGNPMRFKADEDYYEIRSAGADETMDTLDDIYLLGDAAGEYIFDGAGEKSLSRQDFLTHVNPEPFQDPKEYYRIRLPGDYTVIRSSTGNRSEVVFSYARDVRITIAAEPGPAGWQPETAMDRRLEALRRGEDELYQEFTVIGYGLVSVAGASGYAVTLEKRTVLVKEMRLLSPTALDMTITLVTSGAEASPIMDALEQAIEDTLVFQRERLFEEGVFSFEAEDALIGGVDPAAGDPPLCDRRDQDAVGLDRRLFIVGLPVVGDGQDVAAGDNSLDQSLFEAEVPAYGVHLQVVRYDDASEAHLFPEDRS